MKNLFAKLNYKGQTRMAIINAEESFYVSVQKELRNIVIDKEIDPRYPYDFIMIFVKSISDVESLASMALHNLMVDGTLWFCYPKKTSKKYSSDIDRDHGWDALNNFGFRGVRMVAIDDDWTAMRFRNIKYLKPISGKI